MNAGAYERDWSNIVEWALVVTADGAAWLSLQRPGLSGTAIRRSGRARSSRGSSSASSRRSQPTSDAMLPKLNARRKASQPINRRTLGSVFKNPDHELGAGPRCSTRAG